MKFYGPESQAPVDKGARYSHYASGLSGGSKITSEKDPGGNWVKITVEDDTSNDPDDGQRWEIRVVSALRTRRGPETQFAV